MYTRCDGRDNTQKLCDFISIVVPHKKNCFYFFWGERYSRCESTETHTKIQSLNLISCNNNYYLINNKYKNSNNNSDY